MAAACAAVVGSAACNLDHRSTVGGRAIPVRVEVAAVEESRPALHLPAVVEPASSRRVGFRTGGRIGHIAVARGDRVAEGDVVATLDPEALAARVAAARADAFRSQERVARSALRSGRRRQLFALASDAGAAPAPTQIEAILRESELRESRARLAAAESQQAAGVLRAPVEGVALRIHRGVGEVVRAGEPVLSLGEVRSVVVRGSAPRALRTLIHEGRSVEVRAGEIVRRGVVRALARPGGGGSEFALFEVEVANLDAAFLPGARVVVTAAESDVAAVASVTLAALQRGIGTRPFVFVVTERNGERRVERRALSLGGLRGDRVLVTAGLAAGERVVVSGHELLTVGDRVTLVGETR